MNKYNNGVLIAFITIYTLMVIIIGFLELIFNFEFINNKFFIVCIFGYYLISIIGICAMNKFRKPLGLLGVLLSIILLIEVKDPLIVGPLVIAIVIINIRNIKIFFRVISISFTVIGIGLSVLIMLFTFGGDNREALSKVVESNYGKRILTVREIDQGALGVDVAIYVEKNIADVLILKKRLSIVQRTPYLEWINNDKVLINQEEVEIGLFP